jgi:hypothetical protein
MPINIKEMEKVTNILVEIKQLKRRFPMQDGPDIDWATAEKIYEMYSALYGNSQTLERLAERGGFGWKEVAYITSEYKKKA